MYFSSVMIAVIIGAVSLLVFGTVAILGLVFGRRTGGGGYLAAGGLMVMLFGGFLPTVMAGMVRPDSTVTTLHLVQGMVSFVGVGLVVAGIGMNVKTYREVGRR
ncbi:hypothetical protein [Enemella sp. A6]|uniref:hypothetical protein n=1 Tax=Enemella sp. A6 TaxID=3440152 RepID=UPI003EBD8F25